MIELVSHNDVQVGDIIGIAYAGNCTIRKDKEIFMKSIGRYEVIEFRRCLMLREIEPNWFHRLYGDKPLCNFGEDMFVKLGNA